MSQSGRFRDVEDHAGSLNPGKLKSALENFADALATTPMPDDLRAEIQELAGIFSIHLANPTSSASIIREAGKSLRNVIEGTAADLLKNQYLFAVLGIA